ncbi:NACHT domain-containing protein [Streptomyces sp. NPDC051214]|uniref:NACHT domain-containing protein n=1 Tax=Streptomyces sp. NPDC051214 TaxID=3155282 RepID=UPI00341C40EE
MQTARPGALGGAKNEAGATHRAGIAALLATHGLLGEAVPWLESSSVPTTLHMEADLHVDDVVVDLVDGTRVFIQAKLSGADKAFKDAVDQWCRAIESGECRPGDELLCIVTKAPSTIERLTEALKSRRAGASPTAEDTRQLDRLKRLAADRGLDESATSQLLDAANVRLLDARDDGPGEALGAACLNAAVVPAHHGLAAFRALRAAARTQAEQRAPSGLQAWFSWLRSAQLPLVSDATGVPAARMEARREAVTEYRERLAAEQDILPLADLGLGLTSITVAGAAEDLRAAPEVPNDTRDHLVDIVRRQGRLLLIGRPGSGKTVASRLIAARWAATDLAPLPVWLRLSDLLPALPATGPYRLEAADLVRTAAGVTQPVQEEAVLEYVERGQALLLLDGLDETLDRRDAVVEAIDDLLGRLPADLDVVVTTRHSSAQAAEVLQLPVYELQDPLHLGETIEQLLHTVAERFARGEDVRAWIEDRTRRVRESRNVEPDLWRVPLLATLMVLLIAEREAVVVPTTRAGLLAEVIDRTVHGWEKRRTLLPMPGTDPAQAPYVLLDCFDDIAHLVAAAGSASWQDAHGAISDRLQHHWGKPKGTAAAAARHILEYWDATAGVFITDAPQGALTARTRLFAEIGEARWALRDPQNIAPWMELVLASPERKESARLAASLSATAAQVLINRAVNDGGRLLDLVHDAVDDGAAFEEKSLYAYRQAQLARLQTMPDQYPQPSAGVLNFNLGRSPRAALAARLADDELNSEQTAQLVTYAGKIGVRQQKVIAALCAVRIARQRSTELSDDELGILEAALGAASADLEEPQEVLSGLDALVRAAAVHLLPQRPDITSTFVDVAYHTSLNTVEWLEKELPRRGRQDLLEALSARLRAPSAARAFADSVRSIAAPFELFAGLDEKPLDLTPSQAWHLDAAATFVDTLGMGEQAAMVPSYAVQKQRHLTESICHIVLEASGQDVGLISAQLRSLRGERPQHPDWGLLYLPSARTPDIRLAPETLDLGIVLEALKGGNPWLVRLGLRLAANAAVLDDQFPAQLLAILPTLAAETRLNTTALLAYRWPHLTLPVDDPAVRAGAARVRASTLAQKQCHRVAQDLLADPDLLVREHAARFLRNAAPADTSALKTALATPARQWTCIVCDVVLPNATEHCTQRHPRPTPRLEN